VTIKKVVGPIGWRIILFTLIFAGYGSVFAVDNQGVQEPIMWKALNHGDAVSVGDKIRYRSKSNQPLEGEIYLVVKTDQHYFEIINTADQFDLSELPARKVVRLIDVGYNILFERWSELLESYADVTAIAGL
jgi:hypothetical protein